MARFIWCEIVCSSCSETTAGQFTSGAIRRREMAKDAEDAGWVWRFNPDTDADDWFCRACMTRLALKETEPHE